jgi:uncharacterized membrane protein YfcA
MPGDPTLLLLCGFAFLAGLLDAIVGGGGLIQLPALLIGLPHIPLPMLLGTNKLSSVAGTTMAVWQYGRRVAIPWRVVVPAAMLALVGAYAGARCVSLLPSALLRPLVLILLLAVAIYTLLRKDLGLLHAPLASWQRQRSYALTIGSVIGFYDGFFGPGTGSFLVFALISLLGYSFLIASAAAKVLNLATNIGALICFVSAGEVLVNVAVPMGLCNIAGSYVGSRLAIARGTRFVRIVFLGVVTLLLARLTYDLLRTG